MLKIMQESAPPLDSVVDDLPDALVAAVGKALSTDPADRFQTADDFGAELQLIRIVQQSTGDTIFGGDVPFDEIHVGKPWCGDDGFYVDDKAVRPSEFHSMSYEDLRRLLERERGPTA